MGADYKSSAKKYFEYFNKFPKDCTFSFEKDDLGLGKTECSKYNFKAQSFYSFKNQQVLDYGVLVSEYRNNLSYNRYWRQKLRNGTQKTYWYPDNTELARKRVSELCERYVGDNELYYLISVKRSGVLVDIVPIPQTELRYMVMGGERKLFSRFSDKPIFKLSGERNEKLTISFAKSSASGSSGGSVTGGSSGGGGISGGGNRGSNDRDDTNPPSGNKLWYHGSKYSKDKIQKLSDLRTDLGNKRGDFGQGAYLTQTREIAENLIVNQQSGNLLKGKWCNNSLSEKIEEGLKEGKPNKKDVIGKDKQTYSIYIFPKTDDEWKDALIQGWVYEKRVSDCDMVYGPIADNQCIHLSRNIVKALGNKKQLQKEILTFYKRVKAIGLDNGVAFQLCCYKNEVMDNFDTVP